MTPKTKKNDNDAVVQAWKDYEGTVTQARKPYEDAIKKVQPLSELGPASKVLLERVNMSFGNVEIGTLISWARAKTGLGHSSNWWYRRIVTLALEGYIDTRIYRTGDKIAITFKKKEGGWRMNPDQLQELKIKLTEIKAISQSIRNNNTTGKTTGGKYPIRLGYSNYVRRPVQDLLKWISGVEMILDRMLEEVKG